MAAAHAILLQIETKLAQRVPAALTLKIKRSVRGDYLDRYRDEFKEKNGWTLFLKQGAHFTYYYDYAKPCHGGRSRNHWHWSLHRLRQIPLNEWSERSPDGSCNR